MAIMSTAEQLLLSMRTVATPWLFQHPSFTNVATVNRPVRLDAPSARLAQSRPRSARGTAHSMQASSAPSALPAACHHVFDAYHSCPSSAYISTCHWFGRSSVPRLSALFTQCTAICRRG